MLDEKLKVQSKVKELHGKIRELEVQHFLLGKELNQEERKEIQERRPHIVASLQGRRANLMSDITRLRNRIDTLRLRIK